MLKKGAAAMRLLHRFLQIIKSLLPAALTDEQVALLSNLNTHQIYVENVRSLLGVSHKEAVEILETAVRRGVFTKRVGVISPDGSVAASADSVERLPKVIHYLSDDEDGYPEEVDLPTQNLQKVVFYSLDESSESASYPRAG
jgi:hypothetical protein